jgi:hypothetical protein
METIKQSILIVTAIAPLTVITLFNYKKWKSHYVDGNIFGYYNRVLTGKRLTNDPMWLSLIKQFFIVIWFISFIKILF